MIWFTLALFVVSFVIVALLAPKPQLENARAQSLDDVNFPRATENAPIPFILGKVRMQAPNVTWYGNFRTVPIKEKVKTGLFSSKRVTVGYRYFLTMDLALAMGPGVTLTEIFVDDKSAWTGDTGGGAASAVNDVGISFGGYKEGGAMSMSGFFYSGAFDLVNQPIDGIIEGLVGAGNVPAYLGTSHISLDGELGETAQLRKIAFILNRYTNSLGLINNGKIGDDMNPAEAIYQLLTDDWSGLGVSPALVDVPTLQAIGQVLYDEGNGVSCQVTAETTGKKVLEEILRQIDGVAYQDPESGRIIFKLIRDDYDPDLLDIYDEDSILKIQNFSRSGWDEVIAQVKVTFPQRDKESDAVAISQDMATAGMIGRLSSTTIAMPFCYNATLANQLASRERAQLSVPLFRMSIEMNRNGNRLRPGDVFKIAWADYGIQELVMRVQKFDFGSLLDGKLVVQCLQDNFALSTVVFAPPPESNWQAPIVSPQNVLVEEIVEMPRFFMNRLQFPIPDGNAGVIPLPLKPSTASSGFDLLAGDVSGDLDVREPQEVSYPGVGTLLAEYSRDNGFATGFDNTTGFTLFNVTGETFVAANDLVEMRQGEIGLLYCGGEFMGFTGFVDNLNGTVTFTNIYRGLLGTRPRTHAVNARVWQITPELFGEGTLDDLAEDDTLYYKILDRVGPTSIDPADVVEASQLMTRWARRGQRVRNLQIDGQRTGIVIDNTAGILPVTWARSNRDATEIAIETDADQTPDISDAVAELYDVSLYLNGVLVLNSVAQTGPTSDDIDFGAFVNSGPGELRVTTRWDYDPEVDVLNSSEYAYLPFTWDQVLQSVQYVTSGSHVIITSSTSINVPYPAGLNAGDLIICTVMSRSDLTIPAGWVLLERQDGSSNRIYILGRRSDGTETGNLALTQAVANRFIGQMASFQGVTGVPSFYTEVEGSLTNQSPPFTAGSSVIDYDQTIVFATMTNNLASTSTSIEIEVGYNQISPLSIAQNRLGIGISDSRDIGTDDPGIVWTSNVGGATNDISWITGHVMDAYDLKLFNYPSAPTGGVLYRFEAEYVFEDTGRTNPAENADTILGLTDLSGNNIHAAQTTPANAAIYDLANRDAAFATNDFLTTTKVPNNAAGSMFIRLRADLSIATDNLPIGSSDATKRAFIGIRGTDGVAGFGLGSVGSSTFVDPGLLDLRSATDWHTIVGAWDATNMYLYLDGVLVNTTARGSTASTTAIYVGARNGSGSADFHFNGDIFAAGMIDRKITDEEAANMHQYYELAQTS